MDIKIILPARSMDELADGLVALTGAIEALDPTLVAHGCLGGAHGYGGDIETPAFTMRPFCWCDGDDCPWCMGCDCPPSATHYFVDGREVTEREWGDFYDRETYAKLTSGRARTLDDWLKLPYSATRYDALRPLSDEANRRRSTRHDPECAFCRGERFADRGAIPGRTAPNFWHKPSGFKVWWYKYIGRSMETDGAHPPLPKMFAECVAALSPEQPTPSPASTYGESASAEPQSGERTKPSENTHAE